VASLEDYQHLVGTVHVDDDEEHFHYKVLDVLIDENDYLVAVRAKILSGDVVDSHEDIIFAEHASSLPLVTFST
jgi:hypothetical protein